VHQAAPHWARARRGLFALKIRGFLVRPAAEATQIFILVWLHSFFQNADDSITNAGFVQAQVSEVSVTAKFFPAEWGIAIRAIRTAHCRILRMLFSRLV
jgi:hypothetical protein